MKKELRRLSFKDLFIYNDKLYVKNNWFEHKMLCECLDFSKLEEIKLEANLFVDIVWEFNDTLYHSIKSNSIELDDIVLCQEDFKLYIVRAIEYIDDSKLYIVSSIYKKKRFKMFESKQLELVKKLEL